jgi:DNA-binding beta-propeller fold protein YncE
MVLDEASGRLYVVERGANDVVAIDARADVPAIVGSAKVGERPTALALDQASQRLFVANGSSCSITVLDVSEPAPTILGTLAAATGPRGVAVDSSGRAWTANWTGDSITLIDGRATPPALSGDAVLMGAGHVAVAVDDTVSRVVVVSDAGLQAFDSTTGQPTGAITVLPGSYDVTTDAVGTAFVVHSLSGQVTRVDLDEDVPVVTATSAAIAQEPFDVRYAPGLDRVVVPSRLGEVLFLHPMTLEVLERIPSSPTVAATVVDETTGRLWMLDYTYHRLWSMPLPTTS